MMTSSDLHPDINMQAKMTEAEDWLYGDGFDSTKQQYTKKIDELRALGDPIELRLNEEQVGGQRLYLTISWLYILTMPRNPFVHA